MLKEAFFKLGRQSKCPMQCLFLAVFMAVTEVGFVRSKPDKENVKYFWMRKTIYDFRLLARESPFRF